jgi:hypothetical protein
MPAFDKLVAALSSNASSNASSSAGSTTDTSSQKIVCTEVGWPSRPWAYSGRAGITVLDPEDGSVVEQCVSTRAQAMAYAGFLATYYAQPWFDGVLFWMWRADPTAGGGSDDGFVPTGKEAAAVVKAAWGGTKL